MDSTLFSYKIHGIPASTLDALKRLKEQNILRIIATGRHMEELRELPLEQLDMDGFVIMNGQVCCDRNFVPFCSTPFSNSSLDTILRIFNEKKLPILLSSFDRLYLNVFTDAVRTVHADLDRPLPEVGQYQGEDIYQLVVYADKSKTAILEKEISDCKAMHWHPLGADIIPKEGGKMYGIQKMMEYFHCTRDEIVAFGDGPNDIDMLKFAGIGVAMGNADPLTQKYADFVTKDIDVGGILYALENFGIL